MNAQLAAVRPQPTKEELLDIQGRDLFDKHAEIALLTGLYNTARDDFAKLAGEGTTTTIDGRGKVQVTKTTVDRPGDLGATLDLTAFLALPKSLQARLQKDGVVSIDRKVVKGQASTVKLLKA